MNNYYSSPADLAPGTKARSSDLNTIDQSVDAAFDKLPTPIALKTGTVNFVINTSTTDNAYAVAMDAAITSYTDGLEVKMRPVRNNTGPCTLNVNGLGNIAIKNINGSDLEANDIVGTSPVTVSYIASGNVFKLAQLSYSQVIGAGIAASQAAGSASAAAGSASAASGSAGAAAGSASAAAGSANTASNAAAAAISAMTTKAPIDSPVFTGNVGIGATPKAWGTPTLQIKAVGITESNAGAEHVYNAYRGTDNIWRAIATGGSARYGQAGDHRWYVGTANTDAPITWSQAMTLTSDGKLGIGTAPSAKLHVSGDAMIATLNGGTYRAGLILEAGNGSPGQLSPALAFSNGNVGAAIYSSRYSSYGGDLIFATQPSGNSYADPQERMRISAAGNVLIGTTTDGSSDKLQIDGSATGAIRLKHIYSFGQPNYALKLDGDAGTPGGYLSQNPAAGGFQLAAGGTYYGGGNSRTDANSTSFASISGSGGVLSFSTASGLTANTNFSGTERMRIDAVGNVNIGAVTNKGTAPAEVLSLGAYSTNAQYRFLFNHSANGVPGIGSDGAGALVIGRAADFTGTPQAEYARFDINGNLLVGVTSGNWHSMRKGTGSGYQVLGIGNSFGETHRFFTADAGGANASGTVYSLDKLGSTGRSINAAGTVNASGADYAEYMTKADTCGALAKGQIVGVDATGKLTDKWAEAVSFLVKSTDPSYVGGDVWGSEEALGMTRPVQPIFEAPAYEGVNAPGAAPAEPGAPTIEQPTAPEGPAGDADDEQVAAYQAASEVYRIALATYADAHLAFQSELSDYYVAKANHDAALARYEADQQAHADAVAAAHADFDNGAMATYQQQLDVFNATLEAARQKVDRIAYAGQVPVNVQGAIPGQYVVPEANEAGGITARLVSSSSITMPEYIRAVGIVQNILPDGRANIRVKVA